MGVVSTTSADEALGLPAGVAVSVSSPDDGAAVLEEATRPLKPGRRRALYIAQGYIDIYKVFVIILIYIYLPIFSYFKPYYY